MKRSDVPWIERFAKAGGQVVITGNTKMKTDAFERLALLQAGMIVFFFENRWNGWLFWSKTSLLLHWWPLVIAKAKTARRGTFWHIPAEWPDFKKKSRHLRQASTEDLKLAKIERQKADGVRIRAERAKKKALAARPHDLVDLMHEQQAENSRQTSSRARRP